jgi:hypothetical protein
MGLKQVLGTVLLALATVDAPVALAEDAGAPGAASSQTAPSDGGPGDAELDAGEAAPIPSDLESIQTATVRISALLQGELDVEVDPGSLFRGPT